ncbi:MAG TPA: DUF5715 family protein [Bacteroidales bacterium]|nr:DUF5715 family protein [Bacteroidales bacterium]
MKITTRGKIKLAAAVVSLLLIIFLIALAVSGNLRRRIKVYFSPACVQYKQQVYSNKLTDRIIDYSSEAKRTGIKECSDEDDIRQRLKEGSLVRISSGRLLTVEKLSYSYPCLTPDSRDLLEEIARRFREKASQAGLMGSRFIVTSMIRTTDQMKLLRKINSNASANSPHLNGNAFDISYIRFKTRKLFMTECDRRFLKEALAEVIVELRDEDKCWATYERNQSCFHVVAR